MQKTQDSDPEPPISEVIQSRSDNANFKSRNQRKLLSFFAYRTSHTQSTHYQDSLLSHGRQDRRARRSMGTPQIAEMARKTAASTATNNKQYIHYPQHEHRPAAKGKTTTNRSRHDRTQTPAGIPFPGEEVAKHRMRQTHGCDVEAARRLESRYGSLYWDRKF
jgi:hypothetical protein